MTYKEFVSGNIPGVADPVTGAPLKVLVVGNSEKSNIIMSLRGTPGTLFDPINGSMGACRRTAPSCPITISMCWQNGLI